MLKDCLFENEILLWPGAAPGSEHIQLNQSFIERSINPEIKDRAFMGITTPSIIPFFPEEGKGNKTAVVIAPGGAYERVVYDKEGYDSAKWFNALGVTAFVLKYRLPGEGHEKGYSVPLQDAQRAMRLIKHNADQWNLDPNKVGIIGFSAGGHLAATLGTQYSTRVYHPLDEADELDARPSFLILGYPVINLGDREPKPNFEPLRMFPNDQLVDANHPPAFIFHANDDTAVSSDHSVKYYSALKKANVEADLHIFRKGGHGFGIRSAKGPVAMWPKLCEEWLSDNNFI